MVSIIKSVSKDELQEIANNSDSLRDILEKLGLSRTSSGNFRNLKDRLEEDSIDLSILESRRKKTYNSNKGKTPLSEILVENSNFSRVHLKKRLIEENLIENSCSECGLPPVWNGKELIMIIDHINGINNDNRLENLRLLCPNCNSQQDTFAGRNNKKVKKEEEKIECLECGDPITRHSKNKICTKCFALKRRKVERPSQEVLLKNVQELGYRGTAKIYGVSDNTIRKWLK